MGEFLKIISLPTFFQLLARLTTGLATLVLTLILARNLGVENYGDYSKILALATIFYLPADFGLNAAFIQFAQKDQIKKLFSNLFWLRNFLATILILISFLAGFVLYSDRAIEVFIASLTIFTTSATTSALAYYQLRLAYYWPFLASLATSFVILTIIWRLLPNLELTQVFLAILAGQLLGAVINLAKVLARLKFFFKGLDFSLAKNYFKTSFGLGLTLIFNLIYFKIDIILLSILKSSSSVGFYGLATKIFDWAILPPALLLNSSFPVLAKAFAKDRLEFTKVAKTTALILTFSGILVLILLFSFSEFIAVLIGGSEFGQSSIALKILATATPIFYLTGLTMWLLVIINKKTHLAVIYGLGAVLNLTLNLIFIPKFDFLAAATTTVFSEALILAASAFFLLRFFKKPK